MSKKYVQEFIHGSTGDTFSIAVDFDELQLDFLGKKTTHKTLAQLQTAYAARMTKLIAEHGDDLYNTVTEGPPRIANLDRVRADLGQPKAKLHPALLKAKKAFGKKRLDYVIALDLDAPPAKPRIGASKIGGDPDVPSGFEWPGERVFVAQLNCAELAPFDVSGFFPHAGLIHYFINEGCGDNIALYSDAKELERRAAPKAAKAIAKKYYSHQLREWYVTFHAALMGLPGDRDFAVPGPLVKKLSKELGVALQVGDERSRVFGDPDGDRGYRVLSTSDESEQLDYDGELTLALQLQFLDGFLYLGVPPHDLKRGDLSRARAIYWGT